MADLPFRVLPRVTRSNEHFWRGGEHGRLQFLRCKPCGTWIHPPSPVCPSCYRKEIEVAAVSGLGTVATFTLNHQPWVPAPDHPYAIAIVELDAGPRMTARLVDCDPDAVKVGMPVVATYEDVEGTTLVHFRPA